MPARRRARRRVDPHPSPTRRHVLAAVRHGKRPRSAQSAAPKNGGAPADGLVSAADLEDLLEALRSARSGQLGVRLSTRKAGIVGELARAFNELAEMPERTTKELVRVSNAVGRDGKLSERAKVDLVQGSWATKLEAVNALIDNLVRPTREVGRVLAAVAEGDLSQKMAVEI